MKIELIEIKAVCGLTSVQHHCNGIQYRINDHACEVLKYFTDLVLGLFEFKKRSAIRGNRRRRTVKYGNRSLV